MIIHHFHYPIDFPSSIKSARYLLEFHSLFLLEERTICVFIHGRDKAIIGYLNTVGPISNFLGRVHY